MAVSKGFLGLRGESLNLGWESSLRVLPAPPVLADEIKPQ